LIPDRLLAHVFGLLATRRRRRLGRNLCISFPKPMLGSNVSGACIPTTGRKAMPDKTKEEFKAGAEIEPIVVLDLIMPNGKRMRDCTGAEMKRFGDFLLKRAEQFKKT